MKSLVYYLVLGVLVFSGLNALKAAILGNDVAEEAVVGAISGVGVGLVWQWFAWRASRYRARNGPPGPALTRATLASPAAATTLPVRRYRLHPAPLTLMASGAVFIVAMAVWVPTAQEVPVPGVILLWGMALFTVAGAWAAWQTYTEVGPRGIRVRTPLRLHTLAWPELAEVTCERDNSGDTVVLSTQDGRRIKTVGAFVADTGVGRTRTVRMLEHIEKAWAAGEAVHS